MLDTRTVAGPLAGVVSEQMATLWLIVQGYEVFRNVKAYGPADLVMWDKQTNTFTAVDVKTARKYPKMDGTLSISGLPKTRVPNVKYLCFFPDTQEFMWAD